MQSRYDSWEGYEDLDGAQNTARLQTHQEYLRSLGVPAEATQHIDHIGINAPSTEMFEKLVTRYTVPGEKVGMYDRGDRRIAVIERGGGRYRVELFEPRANTTPAPGFIHYAFIWPGHKAHEAMLREKANVTRVGELGGNALLFLTTPDGHEAEIVNEPISFE